MTQEQELLPCDLSKMETGKKYKLTLRKGDIHEMTCWNMYEDYVNFGLFNWNFYFDGTYKGQDLPTMDIIKFEEIPEPTDKKQEHIIDLEYKLSVHKAIGKNAKHNLSKAKERIDTLEKQLDIALEIVSRYEKVINKRIKWNEQTLSNEYTTIKDRQKNEFAKLWLELVLDDVEHFFDNEYKTKTSELKSRIQSLEPTIKE